MNMHALKKVSILLPQLRRTFHAVTSSVLPLWLLFQGAAPPSPQLSPAQPTIVKAPSAGLLQGLLQEGEFGTETLLLLSPRLPALLGWMSKGMVSSTHHATDAK